MRTVVIGLCAVVLLLAVASAAYVACRMAIGQERTKVEERQELEQRARQKAALQGIEQLRKETAHVQQEQERELEALKQSTRSKP